MPLAGAAAPAIPSDISWRLAAAELRAEPAGSLAAGSDGARNAGRLRPVSDGTDGSASFRPGIARDTGPNQKLARIKRVQERQRSAALLPDSGDSAGRVSGRHAGEF